MIISHKYRFIFIKTNKTAGTSIEIALSGFCGENDVITTISPADEKIRQELGYRGPQNHRLPLRNYNLKQWIRSLKKFRLRNIDPHSSARQIKDIVGNKTWDNYYKFCFERNPWDRVISLYYWYQKSRPFISISEFLDTDIPKRLKTRGIENYTIDGKIAVNKICLYENIEVELKNICKHELRISENFTLPRAKSNFRADRRHYREILSMEDADKISRLFSEEIVLFGYKY